MRRKPLAPTTPRPAGPLVSRRSLLPGNTASAPSDRHLRPRRDTLVFVFLRGGMDSLTTVVPYAEDELYTLRPNLAVPPPGSGGAIDLDGFFGLAPSAAPLLEAYQEGDLAIVHAAGSTDPSRSHFEAMARIESATPNDPGGDTTTGWLGRHLASVPAMGSGDLRGIAVSPLMPLTLSGAPRVLPIYDPSTFGFYGYWNTAEARKAGLASMYSTAMPPTDDAASSTLASFELLEAIDFDGYAPENGAVYPQSEFGGRLRTIATMIKAHRTFEVFELDYGGWDDHDDQGPLDGAMAQRLDDLSSGIAAFRRDLLGQLDRVTLVVMSEFGRRVDENGSAGTDHGRGGAMLVLGGHVLGGQVYGAWPGLGPDELDDYAVAVTTDYRDVLAEVLIKRLGARDLEQPFPGHVPSPLGILDSKP